MRRQPWRAFYDDEYAAQSDLKGWDGFFWWTGFFTGAGLIVLLKRMERRP